MKLFNVTALATALVIVAGSTLPAPAAPPTATPSPGYDARLQEQRRAARIVVMPADQPMPRRAKRNKTR